MFNLGQKMTFFLAFDFKIGQHTKVISRRFNALSHISDTITITIVSVRTEFTALDVS